MNNNNNNKLLLEILDRVINEVFMIWWASHHDIDMEYAQQHSNI